MLQLTPVDLPADRRSDPRAYRVGQWIEFHQNVAGFRSGARAKVAAVRADTVEIEHEGQRAPLDLKRADRFQVYEEREISVTVGDRIMVTRHCKAFTFARLVVGRTMVTRHREASRSGRLIVGRPYTVKAVSETGEITLANGIRMSRDHGQVDFGYAARASALPKHPAVDQLLVSMSVAKLREAGGAKALVNFSRVARSDLSIVTDDAAGAKRFVVSAAAALRKGRGKRELQAARKLRPTVGEFGAPPLRTPEPAVPLVVPRSRKAAKTISMD
jgi:hypothetical protein